MGHVITAPATRARHIALTAVLVLVLALLGSAALMATSPATASAADNWACEPGEFCLYRLYNLSGGLYQATGNDPDLRDNLFYYYRDMEENKKLGRVNQNTQSAHNRGLYKDVVVYSWFNYTGPDGCIKKGAVVRNLGSWNNRINSLRWVDPAACEAAGVIQPN